MISLNQAEQNLEVWQLIPVQEGVMSTLIRHHDWSTTSLGAIYSWPQDLLSLINLILVSKSPMALYWTKNLITIYNDAYIPLISKYHPKGLGQPIQEIYSETTDIFTSKCQEVIDHGISSWVENQLLLLDRNNYLEECYFTWSFSPIKNANNNINGVLVNSIETTNSILNERRLKTLTDLANTLITLKTIKQVTELSVQILMQNSTDISFALIYLLSPDLKKLSLSSPAVLDFKNAPLEIYLDENNQPTVWPIKEALISKTLVEVNQLTDKFGNLLGEPWVEYLDRAIIVPLISDIVKEPYGVLIIGVNLKQIFNENYKNFVTLIRNQLTNTIYTTEIFEKNKHFELEKNYIALQGEKKQKNAEEFIDTICHEIRNPLNIMYGGITLLQTDLNFITNLSDALNINLVPSQIKELEQRIKTGQQHLKSIEAAAMQQKTIIDEILNLTKLERGDIEANFTPFDLKNLLIDLKQMFEPQFKQKNINCILNMPNKKTIWLKGDEKLLRRIFINLISNAVKFTNKGSIIINSSIELLEASNIILHFAIKDTGIGIKSNKLPYLFDRFSEISRRKSSSANQGAGLGLAISKKLVEIMGGDIKVVSQEGLGSEFIFTVRCSYLSKKEKQKILDSRKEIIQKNKLNVHSSLESYKILIVEDNTMNQKILAAYLNKKNCLYEIANDGTEALSKYAQTRFDLIFMDIEMPNMNGLEATKRIRDQEKYTNLRTPIIGLTGYTSQDFQDTALECGMDSYITKPCTQETIYAAISKYALPDKYKTKSTPSLTPQFYHYTDNFVEDMSHKINIEKIVKQFRISAKLLLEENYPFIVTLKNKKFKICLNSNQINLSPYIINIILKDLKKHLEFSLAPIENIYIELNNDTQLNINVISDDHATAITTLFMETGFMESNLSSFSEPPSDGWGCTII